MSKVHNVEEIILHASRLFAQHGYDNTSLRQIAHEAKVGLGTINFCFQTKESLFRAVIRRTIDEINDHRRAMLKAARSENWCTEAVLEAAIWPVISRVYSYDPVQRAKPYLVRWGTCGPTAVERYARKLNDAISRELVDAILEATPGLERRDAVWGYSVAMSAIYSRHVLDQRYDFLLGASSACLDAGWAEECTDRLVIFVARGLQALAVPRGDRVGQFARPFAGLFPQ